MNEELDLQLLTQYLKERNVKQIDLSLSNIEAIIRSKLPDSAKSTSSMTTWWNNNPLLHKQSIAWLSAGYETVNLKHSRITHRIVFRKIKNTFLKKTLYNSKSRKNMITGQ